MPGGSFWSIAQGRRRFARNVLGSGLCKISILRDSGDDRLFPVARFMDPRNRISGKAT